MGADVGIVEWATALASVAPGRQLAIVDGAERAAELVRSRPDAFVDESAATGADGLLLLDANAETIHRALELVGQAATPELHVVVERGSGGRDWLAAASERLREAGLAVAGIRRLTWEEPPGGAFSRSRSARLDDETRAALVRCVPVVDPRGLPVLAARLAALERDLEAHRELELAHARTRQAEEFRARRLEQLEQRLAEVDAGLLGEIDRLRAELAELRGSRLVRLGKRYWDVRDRAARLLRGGGSQT